MHEKAAKNKPEKLLMKTILTPAAAFVNETFIKH